VAFLTQSGKTPSSGGPGKAKVFSGPIVKEKRPFLIAAYFLDFLPRGYNDKINRPG